jgi:putative Holliday junction resolvase
MTARSEKFARQLHGRSRLPVVLVDERFSTAQALSDSDAAARRGPLDAEAAAVILRQYLHEREPT